MEDVEKRKNVVLVRPSEGDRVRRFVDNSAFISRKVFSKNLTAIRSLKTKIILNIPIFVGMYGLDLSKHHMYNVWYNHLKKQNGDKISLPNTDTESLIIDV